MLDDLVADFLRKFVKAALDAVATDEDSRPGYHRRDFMAGTNERPIFVA
jgi:hypothetical protein